MASAAENEQRIRALEAQNKDLREQIAHLTGVIDFKRGGPTFVEDDGPRFTYPRTAPIDMPTTAEFERLLIIVSKAYPRAVPTFDRDNDRHEFFLGFCASFERIAHLRRTVDVTGVPVVNLKYDAGDWAHEAYRWLNERGTPAETTNGSFFTAAIAAGDVAFSFANRPEGISTYLGLGYEGLTASTAAWRRVLGTGEPRAASAGPRLRAQLTAEVRYIL